MAASRGADTKPDTNQRVAQARWGAWPGAEWLVVATAAAAFVIAAMATTGDHRAFDIVMLVFAVVPFVLVAVSRRVPSWVMFGTIPPTFAFVLDGGSYISAALMAMALFLAVPAVSRRTGVIAAAVSAASFVVVAIVRREPVLLATSIGMIASWYGGTYFATLLAQLENVRAAGESAADEAVRAERRRLARELHDLVAHALTGTMLCLTEIRLLIDSNRDGAVRALDEAERLARASLGDLRGTVRLLSEEGDPALEPPVEIDADLTTLIDGFRRSGVTISLTTIGEAREVSVASSRAVYRIVQESLTNAVRHAAGASVSIVFKWDTDGVRISITNGRGAPREDTVGMSSGRGIVGMAERATLLGGWLETGPTSKGWAVSAWVPATPFSELATP